MLSETCCWGDLVVSLENSSVTGDEDFNVPSSCRQVPNIARPRSLHRLQRNMPMTNPVQDTSTSSGSRLVVYTWPAHDLSPCTR
ncbi:hypothetical protein ElyMa_006448800 [Elysia marginata]|uniref:Uncharacterized protein n=1 Tax=Elysia marginata TaxID=1093978 RepID=A0AAV4HZF7_9GAST|nr:hypothetical protein ElyMa_006448800 [Elysia marginata]